MILQALDKLYERLAESHAAGLPENGFSRQPVPFALEVAGDGTLAQVEDLRTQDGKKPLPAQLIVPEPFKRGGLKPPPSFLWDNTGYVLGADNKGKPERAAWAFGEFRRFAHAVCAGVEDEGAAAVLAFLDAWDPEKAPDLPYWDEMCGRNVVFRLAGERLHAGDHLAFVHERPAVRKAWLRYRADHAAAVRGQCLVTGEENAPIARLHPDIKGVPGAQTKGASLVSFNLDAFTSYGKTQSFNAPVSEAAAFDYTAALNHLLSRESEQKVRIGDAETVFWTERRTESERLLPRALDHTKEDTEGLKKLHLFLAAARDGKMPNGVPDEGKVRTFVLGLSPNASRLSVRFWVVDTVEGLWSKLDRHFRDLEIVKQHPADDPEYPSIHQLLRSTLRLKDPKDYWKIIRKQPHFPGDFMRAILTGDLYPRRLLPMVLDRIRAEQGGRNSNGNHANNISYFRAALIKACIVRNMRKTSNNQKTAEVLVGLDKNCKNVGYRLGCLFAVLEKIQEESYAANKEGKDKKMKLNATIMDKYYGSASTTPLLVFPTLMRLKVHHLHKFTPEMEGLAVKREKEIQEILYGIEAKDHFPSHLVLEDQGMFALGYYHQHQDLWTSKKNSTATDAVDAAQE